MKKIVLITLFILTAFGCSQPHSEIEKITYKSRIFLEQNLIDYINKNPDLNSKDSIKRIEALNKFQKNIKGLSNDIDFLTDFPLEATNIRDTLMGGQSFKMATFETYVDKTRDKASLLNHIRLRINGIFQFSDQFLGLELGKRYCLKSMIYKQGKRADINYYLDKDAPVYVLGVYPMAVKELWPIRSNDKIASL